MFFILVNFSNVVKIVNKTLGRIKSNTLSNSDPDKVSGVEVELRRLTNEFSGYTSAPKQRIGLNKGREYLLLTTFDVAIALLEDKLLLDVFNVSLVNRFKFCCSLVYYSQEYIQ